jgi:hypothetical protein
MILKPSTKSDELAEMIQFLDNPGFARLPDRVRKAALARRRGIDGEKYTAHILDRKFHAMSDHALIHDLRIPDGIGGYAQFDHIVLSRLSRTAAIFEVKNYGGRLSRNAHDEWMVWYEGRRRPVSIANPLAQVRRQRVVLREWLRANQHDKAFEQIGVFVIMPPGCDIDRKAVTSDFSVYKADNVIAEWNQFVGISPLGKLFSTGVSQGSLRAIGGQLAGAHVPDGKTLHERLRIAPPAPQDAPEENTADAAAVGPEVVVLPRAAPAPQPVAGLGTMFPGAIGFKSKKLESQTMLTLVEVKTGLQKAVATGSARKKDISIIGGALTGSGIGALGGGYTSTDIGKITSFALLDAFRKLTRDAQGRIAPSVPAASAPAPLAPPAASSGTASATGASAQ